jgi:hypothetical protein
VTPAQCQVAPSCLTSAFRLISCAAVAVKQAKNGPRPAEELRWQSLGRPRRCTSARSSNATRHRKGDAHALCRSPVRLQISRCGGVPPDLLLQHHGHCGQHVCSFPLGVADPVPPTSERLTVCAFRISMYCAPLRLQRAVMSVPPCDPLAPCCTEVGPTAPIPSLTAPSPS